MSLVLDYLTDGTPWLIQREMHGTILSIAQRENTVEDLTKALEIRSDREISFDVLLKGQTTPIDGARKAVQSGKVAVMSILGPLFPRANLFSSVSGAMSVEMLAKEMGVIEADDDIHTLVLYFDTPGGQATLINEFSKLISDFSKPVVAYVAGAAASGGYWLASATDKIVLDETAVVGSIGVVAALTKDDDGSIEFVSTNAPDKRPDIESDEGKKVIQARVDDLEDVFINTIMNYRGMSREQVIGLRGGVVIGAKAIEAGFADEIGSLEGLISQLNEENPMDLQQLKADHPDVYQAAVKVGEDKVSADSAEAIKLAEENAVTAERERIGAILGCDEAVGRGKLAYHIATATAMNVDDAKSMLATSAKEKVASKIGQIDAQMEGLNPDVGADDSDQNLTEDDKFVQEFKQANEGSEA